MVEVSIMDDRRIVVIWLSRKNVGDQMICKKIEMLIKQYQQENYMVAVFFSGTQDLYSCTRELLAYNKKRIPQMEIQREKRQSATGGAQ